MEEPKQGQDVPHKYTMERVDSERFVLRKVCFSMRERNIDPVGLFALRLMLISYSSPVGNKLTR